MKSYLEAFLFLSQIHWKNVIYQQNFEISMVLVSTELFSLRTNAQLGQLKERWKVNF